MLESLFPVSIIFVSFLHLETCTLVKTIFYTVVEKCLMILMQEERGEKRCILFPNESFFTLIQRITIDKHSNTLLCFYSFFLSCICLFPLKVLESSNDESPHSDDEVPMMTRRRRPRRARKRAIAASEEETG